MPPTLTRSFILILVLGVNNSVELEVISAALPMEALLELLWFVGVAALANFITAHSVATREPNIGLPFSSAPILGDITQGIVGNIIHKFYQ